jgi:hypothetical protein
MPTMEEVAKQSVEQRIARMARTADDYAAAIRGQSDAVLSRRPDAKNWAAKEVICHMRDTEEGFATRFDTMLAMDDPKFLPINPDRWAEERQYLRNDAGEALAAFRKRREENLAFLKKVTADQFKRGGVHPTRGRMTFDDFVTLMTWHDDNHLDQLKRALDGKA